MNHRPSLLSRTWRVIVFAFLAAVVIGVPYPTALSSSPGPATPVVPSPRNSTAVQAPAGPYLSFLPIISGNPDLVISQVKVIQGTSSANPYAVYVADRPTTVRAFATFGSDTASGVMARIYGYDANSNLMGFFDSGPSTVPSLENNMARTFNFNLPQNWIKPGASYAVWVDPNHVTADSNPSDNRYPAAGTMPFNFSSAQPINVVIVPIAYTPYPYAGTFYPTVNDPSYLEWMMPKVDPAPYVNFSVRGPILVNYNAAQQSENLNDPSGVGWQKLLDLVTSIHDFEDPLHTSLYYGVVNIYSAHNGCPSCYTGLGWVGLPTAVGWSGAPDGDSAAGKTLTHEAGHNFGREHVLCYGNEYNPDPAYPYAGGLIGVWGLDVATGTLYNPTVYADYMSYCPNVWTSDYTYAGIKNFRNTVAFAARSASREPLLAIYVSGHISPEGRAVLNPVYQQLAPVNVSSRGTYTLELLGSGGNVLASYPFTPTRTADAGNFSGFGFFIPAVNGMDGIRVIKDGNIIGERTASTPTATRNFATDSLSVQQESGGTRLRWSAAFQQSVPAVYRVRLSRDGGVTWQVLALDWPNVEFTAPRDLDLTNTRLEVQASDGIHVTTRTFDLK